MPAKSFEIRFILAETALPLRQQVLRPGLTPKQSGYPEDNFETTFHVGAYLGNRLVGVATFIRENFEDLAASEAYRLRGMATDSEFHKQGIGRVVLEAGLCKIQSEKIRLVWCNAREKAFLFYEKLGFQYHGSMFDIPGIGAHKVMYKYL